MLLYLQLIETDEDRSKFEIIYLEYRNLMFFVANRILENVPDAEDAVHQSFLKLIGILDKVEDPYSPKTKSLMAVIAERTAIDMLRKNKRHPTVPIDDLDADVAFHTEDLLNRLDLVSSFAALPPRYRELLLLKYYCGLSTDDIGQMLSMSESNVNKTTQRAKQKLKMVLEQQGATF